MISISSLDASPVLFPESPSSTVREEFEKELNVQAKLREYLFEFLANLPILTLKTIQMQLTSLVHLTESTNQLTRTVLVELKVPLFSLECQRGI